MPDKVVTVTVTVTDGPLSGTATVPVTLTDGTPPPPPTASLTLEPDTIEEGQDAVLSWDTAGADVVTIDGVTVAADGAVLVAPASTHTYTLVATGPGGTTTVTATLTVTTPPPPGGDDDPPPTPTVTMSYGHGDTGPDFGAWANQESARSGNWSDPGTWSLGRVPRFGDSVKINDGHNVTLDVLGARAGILSVYSGGTLTYQADASISLYTLTLHARPGSTLALGRDPGVRHETVIADRPFDAGDPQRWGHGWLVHGRVTGGELPSTKTHAPRAAGAIAAGAPSVTLKAPVVGWEVGDVVAIPDSRWIKTAPQPWDTGYEVRSEVRRVASVSADGRTVTFDTPLTHAHPVALSMDEAGNFVPDLDCTPHVFNLTRRHLWRSENARGVRGHCIASGHEEQRWPAIEYLNTGRTLVDPLGGTNLPKGRYGGLHCHHKHGAPSSADGVAVWSDLPLDDPNLSQLNRARWAFTLHHTYDVAIRRCVAWNVSGAAFVSEDGSEMRCEFNDCWAGAVNGYSRNVETSTVRDPMGDIGFEGCGFWFKGFGVAIRNCGSADSLMGAIYLPNGLPALVTVINPDGTTSQINPYAVNPIFEGVEVYGGRSTEGITVWQLGYQGSTRVPDMARSYFVGYTTWNLGRYGLYNYTTQALTFEDWKARGVPTVFFSSDYIAENFIIDNPDFKGCGTGMQISPAGNQTIRGGRIYGQSGVRWRTRFSAAGVAYTDELIVTLDGVDVRPFQVYPGYTPYEIECEYQPNAGRSDLLARQRCLVHNHKGVAGDNFEVFHDQQAAGFTLPADDGDTRVAPCGGITNQACVTNHGGKCYNGRLMPADAVARPGVYGGKVKAI